MATANPFALLGDDDNDDPSQLLAAQQQKAASLPVKKPAQAAAAVKLPSKPAPPTQAVRDARSSTSPARGGGGRGGLGRGGTGGRGSGPDQTRKYGNGNLNGFSGGYGSAGGGGENGDAGVSVDGVRGSYGEPRQPYRGGRRGGFGNGEARGGGEYGRPAGRLFERRSGSGRGNEIKREGSGRGNWGTPNDGALPQETEEVSNVEEKQPDEETLASEANKEEGAAKENEEKEEEDKEMTLEEYEKIREEKRKLLLSMKAEERKVDFDREFLSMQQLSQKKGNNEVFVKLGSDKDSKRRDSIDRDERVKKSVSINEFLKPAEGERYYLGGRGRGRGRGRSDFGGQPRGGSGSDYTAGTAPVIDDPGHFPTLGGNR